MKTIRTVYLQDVVTIIDNDDITSIVVHGKVYDKVKFGKWIPSDPPDAPVTKLYKCSVCGLGYEDDDTDCEVYYPWKYCPHCGARMEAEDDSAEEC